MKNLLEFCDAVINNGGATFNLVTGTSPTSGYIVSDEGQEEVTKLFGGAVAKEMLITSAIKKYISDKGFILSLSDKNLGAWVDSNKLYLDISVVYDNEQDAIEMARKNNQLAYFDLNNNETKFI
jgi:hypothetical protein